MPNPNISALTSSCRSALQGLMERLNIKIYLMFAHVRLYITSQRSESFYSMSFEGGLK